MNDKINKTSICSVIALDIIDYAKKSKAEQIEIRKLFNGFIQHAVIDIPQDDRLIVETASGAAIACSGPLEDALEDALFISITIRDEILKHNIQASTPLYVQFGIHLGAARVVKNTMVGEGIGEAKRIMSFANPNQILVSQVYFEMVSKLTQEMAQMFEKYEMHAYEHDVYAVRLLKEAATDGASIAADNAVPTQWQLMAAKLNWTYVGYGLLALAAFFVLAKLVVPPIEPAVTPAVSADQPVVANPVPATELTVEPNQGVAKQDGVKNTNISQKKTNQKAATDTKEALSKSEKSATNNAAKPAESKTEKSGTSEKSSWQTFKDSVKQGKERECTQAEIAMNQCAK